MLHFCSLNSKHCSDDGYTRVENIPLLQSNYDIFFSGLWTLWADWGDKEWRKVCCRGPRKKDRHNELTSTFDLTYWSKSALMWVICCRKTCVYMGRSLIVVERVAAWAPAECQEDSFPNTAGRWGLCNSMSEQKGQVWDFWLRSRILNVRATKWMWYSGSKHFHPGL